MTILMRDKIYFFLKSNAACMIVFLFIISLCGCSSDIEDKVKAPKTVTSAIILAPETEPIASVDGREVPLDRFNEQYESRIAKLRKRPSGVDVQPAMALSIKKAVAAALIDEQLVEQAAKERKLSVTDVDIDIAWNNLEQSVQNKKDFQSYIDRFPNREQGVRQMLRMCLLKDRLAGVDPQKKISEAEAQAYYKKHFQRFNIPAHLVVQDVFFPVTPGSAASAEESQKAKAEAVLVQARQPDIQFSTLARKYSQGRSAYKGGWLRRVTEKEIQPELWKTLSVMQPNQISGLVRASDGYHILRLVRRVASATNTIEQVEAEIKSAINTHRRSYKIAQLINNLRNQAKIDNDLEKRYSFNSQRAKKQIQAVETPIASIPIWMNC